MGTHGPRMWQGWWKVRQQHPSACKRLVIANQKSGEFCLWRVSIETIFPTSTALPPGCIVCMTITNTIQLNWRGKLLGLPFFPPYRASAAVQRSRHFKHCCKKADWGTEGGMLGDNVPIDPKATFAARWHNFSPVFQLNSSAEWKKVFCTRVFPGSFQMCASWVFNLSIDKPRARCISHQKRVPSTSMVIGNVGKIKS